MGRKTREVWQILKLNIGNILLFELIYRMITLPFYVRAVNRGIRFALDMAGYSYLTVENIGRFLGRPWTLAILAVLGLVGTLLLSVEVAGVITALESAAYHRRISFIAIFTGGVQRVCREMEKRNAGIFILIMIEYMLMSLFCLYRLLTHIKPFNFILMEIWRGPVTRHLLLLFLAVCLLAEVFSVFVVPVCMVENTTFFEGLKKGFRLMRGHLWRMMGFMLIFNLLPILWMIICYAAAVVISALFTVLFVKPNLALAVLLGVSEQAELVLLFFGGVLSVASNLAAVMVMYYQYGQQLKEEPSWDFGTPERKSDRQKMIAVLTAAGAISALCLFDMVQNGERISEDMMMEVQITAHRGSSKTAPENTMAAIQAAVEELADFAEIDVQLSRDGEVVVCHDFNLKRLAGVNRTVASMDWEELRRLDVGGRFSEEYAGEGIPLLRDVMEQYKGKIDLNIELKNSGKSSRLPELVAELVAEFGMEEQCVITSTSLHYLERVKNIMPELRTGYIIAAAYGDYYSEEALDFISIRSGFVNQQMVQRAHENGKAVHAWTVNSKSELERMKLLQVDNVITDYPVLAREILYREEATESLVEYLRLAFRL